MSSWDGSDICRSTGGSLFQIGGTAMAIKRFANLRDDVAEGRISVMEEKVRVERRTTD